MSHPKNSSTEQQYRSVEPFDALAVNVDRPNMSLPSDGSRATGETVESRHRIDELEDSRERIDSLTVTEKNQLIRTAVLSQIYLVF